MKRTDDLKQDLKDLGWSYTISYGGGFKEKIADDGSESFDTDKPQFNKISFVVYNYNRLEDRDLLDEAIALCDKYDQDDIYYQEPNGKAYWYNKDGEKDAAFSCMTKNDDDQMYFTGFGGSKLSKKTRDIYTKKHQVKNAKAFDHRFSGIMEAIALPPNTRIEEIKRNDLYTPIDSYTGDITGYAANCPLCGGTLGCTGQNVLDGTTTYNDKEYGEVRIVASSLRMPCGSIVEFKLDRISDKPITAIVLDRGVTGTSLDLLVENEFYAINNVGRVNITYNVLRYGYNRQV